ncbi:MAG: hypothetical protein JWR55_988 [Aeromicrobium sp.]|nr:hypothetical protein [Aeromicrobium sp.]
MTTATMLESDNGQVKCLFHRTDTSEEYMGGPAASPGGVEVRHLLAFIAVAEHLSFTRAAVDLCVTQPSLSRTIAQLERLVNASLLLRTKRRVELTDAGRAFLPYARSASDMIGRAVEAARSVPVALRVSFTWNAAAGYSTSIVKEFERLHPAVVVDLRRVEDPLGGLGRRRADVSFLPGAVVDDRVATLQLALEPRVAALPAGHPLASHTVLTLAQLRGETIVINVVSSTTPRDLWAVDDDEPAVLEVNNIEEWMEAIAAGRGVGTTLRSAGQMYSHPGLVYRPISDCVPVPITVAWHRDATHPMVADFIAVAHRFVAVVQTQENDG